MRTVCDILYKNNYSVLKYLVDTSSFAFFTTNIILLHAHICYSIIIKIIILSYIPNLSIVIHASSDFKDILPQLIPLYVFPRPFTVYIIYVKWRWTVAKYTILLQ